MGIRIWHCGCCGRKLINQDATWCLDCSKHVSTDKTLPLHEQTYYSMNGVDCPFEDSKEPA